MPNFYFNFLQKKKLFLIITTLQLGLPPIFSHQKFMPQICQEEVAEEMFSSYYVLLEMFEDAVV